MKTKLFLFSLFGLIPILGSAQNNGNQIPPVLKMNPSGDALSSDLIHIPCTGSFFVPSADPAWRPGVSHKLEESEPLEPDHDKLEKIRAELLARKLSPGWGKEETRAMQPAALAVTPVVGTHYSANKANGWSPLDNNMAISNKGIIVSVANDTFEVDDSLGNNLYYNTLNTFINDNTIPNACDPVILYDVGADRFIFYCQEVTSTANTPNHMMVFFSKTNNPATGGWNYFKLSGNPLNDGSDADYPKLAVSDHDLFISSNLFKSGNFNQAIVWQIEKAEGYSGGTLVTKLWSGVTGSPFTLLPVGNGQGQAYGPGCWMVATSSSGSSTLDLYQITGDVSGTPAMNHYSVATTAYSAAGPSPQKGTSATLSITDCRALGGFYLNGLIHFVFNGQDAQGNTCINYNRLDVSAKTNVVKSLSVNGTDYGYPAVASYTALGVTNDNSVMIGFAQANSSMYPEISVVSCDNSGNFGTVTSVKNSDSYVGSSGSQRWGDYSGMCRRHNSPQACCWMAGAFGTTSNVWGAYVAQIYDAGFATGIPAATNLATVKTYPNPVMDMFSLDFSMNKDEEKVDIGVYDMQGRLVKDLYNGFCHEGENTFSFNKANLSQGTYLLLIRAGGEQVAHDRIIVAD
ncbi:MAG TPA: T9SS type A sorting domain-containing protein [Bacteroidia bacterium]|jgi:hypothetical protein|nr:T9SS type A sorting domain-containing protein [Bacteroidia bacterium]